MDLRRTKRSKCVRLEVFRISGMSCGVAIVPRAIWPSVARLTGPGGGVAAVVAHSVCGPLCARPESSPLNIAVALLIFNRADATQRVVDAGAGAAARGGAGVR